MKFFVAGAYGHWQDINSYYTSPPRILSIPALSGSYEELETTIQLLLAAAKSSNRALLLPSQATLLAPTAEEDGRLPELKPSEGTVVAHRRYIYSIFHLEQLEKDSGVQILEPNYIAHAAPHLVQQKKYDMIADLAAYQELDLRWLWMYKFVEEALEKDHMRDAMHVRISTDEGPDGFWRSVSSLLL